MKQVQESRNKNKTIQGGVDFDNKEKPIFLLVGKCTWGIMGFIREEVKV